MAPIIKNGMIKVVDSHGNNKGVTYLKRAKGLVKNGRARYIDDNIICISDACPPENKNLTEDNIMSEVFNNEVRDNNGNIVNQVWKDAETGKIAADEPITAASILRRIDEIICSQTHFVQAIEAIKTIEATDVQHGSNNTGKKADAIRDAVRVKEETNQKVIDFLRVMYEDMRPNAGHGGPDESMRIVEKLTETLKYAVEADNNDAVAKISDMIRDIYRN